MGINKKTAVSQFVFVFICAFTLLFKACSNKSPMETLDNLDGPTLADTAWPMSQQNPQHTGLSPYNGPVSPKIKWDLEVDPIVSPIIGPNGDIYVANTSALGGSAQLSAVDIKCAVVSLKWSTPIGDGVFSGRDPAVASDGTVYVPTIGGILYAIQPNGVLRWTFNGEGPLKSPVIGSDGTIYFSADSALLYAINSDGSLKWSYQMINITNNSPALGSDGVIYINDMAPNLYAFHPDGQVKWTLALTTNGSNFSNIDPVLANDGTIYVGYSAGGLYAVTPTGELKWRWQSPSKRLNSRSKILLGPDGTIYIDDNQLNLYAINPDGTTKWSIRPLVSLPGIGRIGGRSVGADGTIFLHVNDGPLKLLAINPSGTQKWELPLRAGNRAAYSSPVIASDGIIYLGSENELFSVGAL